MNNTIKIHEDELELSKICWNKFEEFHQTKIVYFKNIYSIFSDLKIYLTEFQNKYNSLHLDELINPRVDDQFNELIKYINKSMLTFFDSNNVIIKSIITEFKDINNIIKNESCIYEKITMEQKKYKEKKEKLDKTKNNFLEKMINIEDLLKEKIISKKNKISVDIKKMNQAMKEFHDYKIYLEDFNKAREAYNTDQTILLEENYKVMVKNEFKLYEIIKKKFNQAQKNNYDFSSIILEKFMVKKETPKQKSERENDYINKVINKFKSKEKQQEKIKLIEYHLKHKPYVSDVNCKPEDMSKAIQINDELLKYLRKAIKDNYPDSGLQIQEAEFEIPEVFKHFFARKVELTKDLKELMLKLLKEDMSLYHKLLIILGKLRADGKLFSSYGHMKFITILFIEILKLSEQNLDYKAVKDCILLSQTYYITDEKTNTKIYSFEKLKQMKWIRTPKFWRDFLDIYINKEFNKFEYMNQLKVKLKDNPDLDEKKKNKVKEVLFSCLVPYLNNMIEMNLDRRIIIKILDEIIGKYKYLDKENITNLESFISSSPEDIVKLRQEIKENPNFESEIENAIKNEEEINFIEDEAEDCQEPQKNEIHLNNQDKKDE